MIGGLAALGFPELFADHQAAQSLPIDPDVVPFGQHLACQGGAEIGVLVAHDRDRPGKQGGISPAVAWPAAPSRDDGRGAVLTVGSERSLDLPDA